MPLCWWINECPLEDECSKASWQKTHNCTSFVSEQDARDKLMNHLRSSSLHYNAEESDHENLVLLVDVKNEDVPDSPPPAPKRKAPPSQAVIGAPASKQHRGNIKQNEKDISKKVATEVARQLQQHSSSSPGAASSSGVTALIPVVNEAAVVSAEDAEYVTIRKSTLKVIQDSCERVSQAALHAVRISQSARNAFEEEHQRIAEVTKVIQEIINSKTR